MVIEARRTFLDRLFRRPLPEVVPEMDADGEVIREFILDNYIADEYPNGVRYYDVRIEENSAIWNRLRLK